MDKNECMKHVIIVQGGGFRTGFSTGVLDGFRAANFNPFDTYIGISGGAIALSYFLSEQYGSCVKSMQFLATHPEFIKLKRVMKQKGYMDIDQLREVAEKHVPFDLKSALSSRANKNVHFVVTDRVSGQPLYLDPEESDWLDIVIASCTLPFVTKGAHKVRGLNLFDGGWGDSLPVEWAHKEGASKFTIIRTLPKDRKVGQSWPDYLGSLYFRKHPDLAACFARSHDKYNDAIDYINEISDSVEVNQISPEEGLKCSTYNYSVSSILADYRYGFQLGINHAKNLAF